MASGGRRAARAKGPSPEPIAPARPGSNTEHTVARIHPSARRLALPAVAVIVVAGATAYATGSALEGWQRIVLPIAGAVIVLVVGVLPFLLWASHVYLITTRRVVATRGLVRRTRRELVHSRANRLELVQTAMQRAAGSGDVIAFQGEREVFRLVDVPGAELVERALLDMMELAGGSTLARGRQPEETRRSFDPPVR